MNCSSRHCAACVAHPFWLKPSVCASECAFETSVCASDVGRKLGASSGAITAQLAEWAFERRCLHPMPRLVESSAQEGGGVTADAAKEAVAGLGIVLEWMAVPCTSVTHHTG